MKRMERIIKDKEQKMRREEEIRKTSTSTYTSLNRLFGTIPALNNTGVISRAMDVFPVPGPPLNTHASLYWSNLLHLFGFNSSSTAAVLILTVKSFLNCSIPSN